MIGDSSGDLQNKLFSIFTFIFVCVLVARSSRLRADRDVILLGRPVSWRKFNPCSSPDETSLKPGRKRPRCIGAGLAFSGIRGVGRALMMWHPTNSWWAFCYGLIVSELPYLVICAVL
jgi:hypothetical protein